MPQISLRQLLLLVAAVAFALVSLRFASENLTICIYSLTIGAACAAVIVAIVGRGPDQSFAAGMAVCMIGYGLLIVLESEHPSGPLVGPETALLTYLHSNVGRVRYFLDTGEEYSQVNSATLNKPVSDRLKAGKREPLGYVGGVGLYRVRLPELAYFLSIGYCWVAILLGYVGGQIARFVYKQRTKVAATEAKT